MPAAVTDSRRHRARRGAGFQRVTAWLVALALAGLVGCARDRFRAAVDSTAETVLPQSQTSLQAVAKPLVDDVQGESVGGVILAAHETELLHDAAAVDARLPRAAGGELSLDACIQIAMRQQPRLELLTAERGSGPLLLPASANSPGAAATKPFRRITPALDFRISQALAAPRGRARNRLGKPGPSIATASGTADSEPLT